MRPRKGKLSWQLELTSRSKPSISRRDSNTQTKGSYENIFNFCMIYDEKTETFVARFPNC